MSSISLVSYCAYIL